MLGANANADSVLGGILRTLEARGCAAVPTLAARARPGGRVEDAAYATLRAGILDAARAGGFDAIALCLHGCMQTASLDSAEADLLAGLRAIVGPDMPIVAGFDLHAHAVPSCSAIWISPRRTRPTRMPTRRKPARGWRGNCCACWRRAKGPRASARWCRC